MSATDQFFTWYYEGLSGIGGWLIFALIALAAVAWLIYDSQTRRIRALGWLMGGILLALLMLPSLIYRFVSQDTRATLDQFKEVLFYLGLLGGIMPAVVAIGYFVSYRGMMGCDRGHIYDATLGSGNCPVCAAERAASAPPPVVSYGPSSVPVRDEPPTEFPQRPGVARPSRQKAGAWLVDSANNRRYDLYVGDTRIGRKTDANDVVLGDPAVGREHCLIREANCHFTLYDRGSKTGTLVNGKRLRGPLMLENGDEIGLGDTVLKFMAS